MIRGSQISYGRGQDTLFIVLNNVDRIVLCFLTKKFMGLGDIVSWEYNILGNCVGGCGAISNYPGAISKTLNLFYYLFILLKHLSGKINS